MWTIAQWGIAWCVVSVLLAYVLGRTILRSGKVDEAELKPIVLTEEMAVEFCLKERL